MPASRAASGFFFFLGSLMGALAVAAFASYELHRCYGEDGWPGTFVMLIPPCVMVSVVGVAGFAVVAASVPAVTGRGAGRLYVVSGVLGLVGTIASIFLGLFAGDAEPAGLLFVPAVVGAALSAGTLSLLMNVGWIERVSEHHCPGCGYDLRELRSARCPECGTTVDGAERPA
jgi:amino acid transporter